MVRCISYVLKQGFIMLKKLLFPLMLLVPVLAYSHDYDSRSYQVVQQPQQECWTETVASASPRRDYAGTIIGGVAGGLLGNQVGRGNGRVLATALGAVTGSVVGDNLSERHDERSTREVRHCRTVMHSVRMPVAQQPVVVNRIVSIDAGDDYSEYHHHNKRHHHNKHHHKDKHREYEDSWGGEREHHDNGWHRGWNRD
jgi:uncharacterized protein YcfJ